MLGAKRRESLGQGKQLILRVFSKGQAIMRAGKVSNGGWTPTGAVRISTRETIHHSFNRLTASVPLLDSMAYALKLFVWSEFDLWHDVCTYLL